MPVANKDGSIGYAFVSDDDFDPTKKSHRRAVGIVNRVLEDGRAEIAVRVA